MIGTKQYAEAVDPTFSRMVGKRSKWSEAEAASDRGPLGSENADISNDKHG